MTFEDHLINSLAGGSKNTRSNIILSKMVSDVWVKIKCHWRPPAIIKILPFYEDKLFRGRAKYRIRRIGKTCIDRTPLLIFWCIYEINFESHPLRGDTVGNLFSSIYKAKYR